MLSTDDLGRRVVRLVVARDVGEVRGVVHRT
jgi:hypothetical protein